MALPSGTKLGPYEIVCPLGAGGMGEVYRALDRRLGREVAIKVLPPQFVSDADRLRRFQEEARATAALNHANILVVYDIGTDSDEPYVVSELLEGQTLRQLLDSGPLSIRRAVELGLQAAAGLAAAHARGIVHRDVKPENLFVTAEGRLKILDFGLAKRQPSAPHSDALSTLADAMRTGEGVILGTVGYVSPEQAAGRTADFRSDQFALGIVLYEMISGQRTFQRPTAVEELAAIIRDEPRPLAEVNPETPLPLQWLVARCLQKEPSERYESTRDLVRDLEALSAHLSRAPKRTARPPGAELPVHGSSLIGRQAEVAAAIDLVRRDAVRLVTFTGAGGTGKTRLALRVAADLQDRFPGGVYFVGLASATDAESVALAISQAMGVQAAGSGRAAELLVEHVERSRDAPTLLVLDSFDRAISAAPLVARLLQLAVPLKVMVTSREPLRLYEEHELPVLPLPCPETGAPTSLAALATNPAVALFVERARSSVPSFTLTDDNAQAVADICRQVDGLPLAIELAAARTKLLPPAAMLGRLQQRLQLLTGGPRDRPERQQTLRGAIAWSYDLLDGAEQRLFWRLTAFTGGCSLDAAEAVCDTRQDLGIFLLDGVESLVNKSLVRQTEQASGEARLSMLGTIREFGREKLIESGEEAAVREAHAAYFVILAEEAAAVLESGSHPHWLAALDRDHDNVRRALGWLCDQGRAEWALRLAAAMFPYWQARELITEGRRWLDAALRVQGGERHREHRAKAAFAASVLAWSQHDSDTAVRHGRECQALYAALGDDIGVATALNAVGVALKSQGEGAAATEAFEQSLQIWRDVGNEAAAARSLSNLSALLKEQGSFQQARERLREAREIFQRGGDGPGVAWSQEHEGDLAWAQGDADAARALYEEALSSFAALGDRWGEAGTQTDLGQLALATGDLKLAEDHFRAGLEAFEKLGHRRGLARTFEGLSALASRMGQGKRALILAGAAAALREELGTPLAADELRRLEEALLPAQQALGTDGRSQEWIRGWNMPFAQAMQLARTEGPES